MTNDVHSIKKTNGLIGQPCLMNEKRRCISENTECIDEICMCASFYKAVDGVCVTEKSKWFSSNRNRPKKYGKSQVIAYSKILELKMRAIQSHSYSPFLHSSSSFFLYFPFFQVRHSPSSVVSTAIAADPESFALRSQFVCAAALMLMSAPNANRVS